MNIQQTYLKVTGFVIYDPGDPKSGIPQQQWNIEGDFYFENEIEKKEFEAKLKDTFEIYTSNHLLVIDYEVFQNMNI